MLNDPDRSGSDGSAGEALSINGSASPQASTNSKYALFILTVIYVASLMDRQILSILQQDIRTEFHLSDTQLGLLTGFSFAMFYGVLGIPVARFADRYNRVVILAVALGLWSAMTMLCGVGGSYAALFLARIGVGIGEAGCVPASHALLSDFFDKRRLPGAMAVYGTGTTVGAVLGIVVGGLVAENHNWRLAFYIAGAPGLLLALVLLITVRDPRWSRVGGTPMPVAKRTPFWATVRELRGVPVLWPALFGQALIGTVTYAAWSWSPPFLLRTYGVERMDVVLGMVCSLIAGGTPGILAGGFLASKLGGRNASWHARIPMIGALIGTPLYIAAFSGLLSFWPCVALLTIGGFFTVWGYAPLAALVQSSVASGRRAFVASLLVVTVTMLGLGIGPAVVGAMSDHFAPRVGTASLAVAMMIFSCTGLAAAAVIRSAVLALQRACTM